MPVFSVRQNMTVKYAIKTRHSFMYMERPHIVRHHTYSSHVIPSGMLSSSISMLGVLDLITIENATTQERQSGVK